MRLKEQTAIVTGSSRGIGAAIAQRLANEGARVAVCASRNIDSAEAVAGQIRNNGGEALAFKADVSQTEDVETLVKNVIDAWGKIDILVNNAGITRDNLIMRMKEDEWDDVLDVNLKGAYRCIKAVTRPMMKARGGRIINVSSVVGLMGNAGQLNYAASKSGIIGITKSAAKELGSRNITVNAIAPGFIPTDMTAELTDDVKTKLIEQIPLGKLGNPEDIAAAVAFLASSDANYITGQVIVVDGGMVM